MHAFDEIRPCKQAYVQQISNEAQQKLNIAGRRRGTANSPGGHHPKNGLHVSRCPCS